MIASAAHAHAGDDPGGADGARPDADLDRVGPGVDQRFAPSPVAMLPATICTAFDMRRIARRSSAPLGMAVRRIDTTTSASASISASARSIAAARSRPRRPP